MSRRTMPGARKSKARPRKLTVESQQQHEVARYLREHAFVHESLVEICDLVGEAMAGAHIPDANDEARLQEINLAIWSLRWKLRLHGGLTTKKKREDAHG